jgi:thiamine biosynthesis lipoprotein
MGTLLTIHMARPGAEAAVERAFQWFYEIEQRCSRFDPESELSRLTRQIGVPVEASDMLFHSVQFALTVAEESGGAFDPTVGHRMETRGYNREHRTQQMIQTPIAPEPDISYRDVQVDTERKTITLKRPLLLDLGAVAKGFAIDVAARELAEACEDFTIDAGGDLYLGGHNPEGQPWSVGIRHPRIDRQIIDRVTVTNQAVCTSGDYERGHHVIDPRNGEPVTGVASATVIAPTAMLADSLATAAFVLGPAQGIELLRRVGVQGLIFTPELERYET